MMEEHYRSFFQSAQSRGGAQAKWIANRDDIRSLTAFFAWTAWTATANRPGTITRTPIIGRRSRWRKLSYRRCRHLERNFDHRPLGGTGLVFYFFGRYDWLGWSDTEPKRFVSPVEEVAVTSAQSAIVWFLLVSSLLFVLQTLTGGLIAHYRAEPEAFSASTSRAILPFNIVRTWHVQLAIFWVSASYLATGIFIVPLIAGRERRGQAALTMVLLIAVAIVVFGSISGEYAGAQRLVRRGALVLARTSRLGVFRSGQILADPTGHRSFPLGIHPLSRTAGDA